MRDTTAYNTISRSTTPRRTCPPARAANAKRHGDRKKHHGRRALDDHLASGSPLRARVPGILEQALERVAGPQILKRVVDHPRYPVGAEQLSPAVGIDIDVGDLQAAPAGERREHELHRKSGADAVGKIAPSPHGVLRVQLLFGPRLPIAVV